MVSLTYDLSIDVCIDIDDHSLKIVYLLFDDIYPHLVDWLLANAQRLSVRPICVVDQAY